MHVCNNNKWTTGQKMESSVFLTLFVLFGRLYKELCLPPGKEERMKGKDGGPTLTCMKGWISLKGREATVQALLMATNRAERKDCTLCLEKSLGCQLDHVDSGVDDMTRKMGLLSEYILPINL